MAAGGCMDSLNKGRRTDDLHDHASTITLLDMMRPDRILQYDNFDLSASAAAAMRNEAGLAKCLERLAKSASVNKNTSAAVNTGRRSEPQKGPEFVGERRNHRYDRAASTDR
ncbi:hypothetical protein HPB47_022094 [Ixodes persulcatus]|uniref:Uncharacterized protein n=1 Tax=Ixodes persulcatus TaxID=34615 RepID=A0AC60QBN4_IXOPE|nr:hypothetical protein HPB47_022094 [Ixodes persulcatus]